MDASQITKLLQKQNTRYINRSQTVDSSTLTWKNQIESSKYIKGVKTCDGQQNCNVPTNPACSDGNGICSFGGSGRTTAIQTGSPQQFLNVLSGAAGSASEVYSSERILLQQAGKQSCGVPGTSPAPQNSYVELSCGTNIICTETASQSSTWNSISGFPFNPADLNNTVRAIVVDTNGDVYVGGDFTQAIQSDGSSLPVLNIAKWDGTSWSALPGSPIGARVNTIIRIGNILYIGGTFDNAAYRYIASYNTTDGTWSPLEQGLNNTSLIPGAIKEVAALATINNILYVGGSFNQARLNSGGTISVPNIAAFDLSIFKWIDTSMTQFNTTGRVFSLAVNGSNLYVGGSFLFVGGSNYARIAVWNTTSPSSWSQLGSGTVNDPVLALTFIGDDLYVGGSFISIGGSSFNRIAKWDGSDWFPLISGGINGLNDTVRTLNTIGNTLYVGGNFTNTSTPSIVLNRIASWNTVTSSWSALGSGILDNQVFAIATTNNKIYVGGSFTEAGDVTGTSYIAQFTIGQESTTICKQYSNYICTNTNGPVDGRDVPVNNQSNPYLPPFDTYYRFKNPSAQCQYPIQDQNQKHFVKQCHTRFPNANNGVNAVCNPCDNTTYLNPVTKQFETKPYFVEGTNNVIPPTCDECILEK
jgi:hypothetical protein